MDREILFRGKRIDNGEWVEGFVVTMPNTSTTKILAWCKSYIVDGEGRQEFNVHEVVPSTVGQYTGLTDKNGVKIFEGDILRGEFYGFTSPIADYTFSVDWQDEVAGWGKNYFEPSKCVVVGNIYDGKDGQHDEL